MGIESVLEIRSEGRCGERRTGERPRELRAAWGKAPARTTDAPCLFVQTLDRPATHTMTETPTRRDREGHGVEGTADLMRYPDSSAGTECRAPTRRRA